MDLFDVARSCVRRWYVLLPLLLVTAYYSYNVYSAVRPVYYSQAVIGLAPPSFRIDQSEAGQPVPRNGLLDVGGAPLLANMAALGLRQPAVVDRVVTAGGMPDFSARLFPVPDTSPPIPLVMIEQTAPDPTAATKTLDLVTAEFADSLQGLQKQAKVPDQMMVEPFVVSPPSTPIAAMPSRTRSTASVFVAGLGLSVLAAVLLDVLLSRWAKRRQERSRARSDTELPPSQDTTAAETPQAVTAVEANEGAAGTR